MVKSKAHKAVKIALCIAAVLSVLVFVNFIPTFYLENPRMNEIRGEYVTVYYEKEDAAARDVLQLAESESKRITEKLGISSSQGIKLYIYDQQSTMQMKKYGLVVLFLNLDWYIGDNRATNVILTSPANPGSSHDYDVVKDSAVHEMVHAYNYVLNPNMPLWVTEGMAVYLTGQKPPEVLYPIYYEPTIAQTHTNSPLEFEEMMGYEFAYTYIEYLDSTFGWDSLLTYSKTNDFIVGFGKDESDIYDGWIAFLKANYSR